MAEPVDALDAARIGDVTRDVALDAFWDWYDETPEPIPSELNTPEARMECFERHTCWLRQLSDRELGERVVSALERLGYEVRRA